MYYFFVNPLMRRCKRYFACAVVVFVSVVCAGQAINNNGIERDALGDRYFRVNYENDFFSATDLYYTQGFLIEMAHPAFSRFPLMKVLPRPANDHIRYSIALEDDGYTPTDYRPADILYGDRPYAGMFFLKTSVIADNSAKKRRLASSVSIGIIGPGAGGKEMQTGIHEVTGNGLPHGWHNQIKNDVILNYEVRYSRQLLQAANYLNVSATGMVRAGTLSDKASAGLLIMAGVFDLPYEVPADRKVQVYLYDHPEVSFVGYDATLQGGMINRNSPYVIASKDISRIVVRNNIGLIMRFGNLYLEYFQSMMTREFSTGRPHNNGGVQIGFAF